MNEFKKLYDDKYFIITSDNLENIHSKLYGFAIINDNIIFNSEDIDEKQLDGTGVYIYITKKDDKINIFQDFNGCYGLYYYHDKETNYFAISNSFLKLVEYLKEKTILTLNKDCANAYISSDLSSLVYRKTLVNEIEMLPENVVVNINTSTKSINFSKIDYQEFNIDINSKEGIDLLDQWYYKWINIINNVYANTDNITIDLSGGFDTRLVLSLILSSDIDLNKIQVNSIVSDNKTFAEDYEIASKIATDFGFKLNENEPNVPKYYFQELETSINLSYYTKLGFSKQMEWKNFINTEKVFQIRGYGLIRNFYNFPSIEEYTNFEMSSASKHSPEIKNSVKKILNYNFQEYKKDSQKELSIPDLLYLHYKSTRNRYHYGKESVNSFLANIMHLSPLMDPLLDKLNIPDTEYDNLVMALIYSRYYPKLLDYNFQGNRSIDKKAIDLAKKINEKYPFKKDETKIHKTTINKNITKKEELPQNKSRIKENEQIKLIKNIFLSNDFKEIFLMYFPENIYNMIIEEQNKLSIENSLNNTNTALSILKIIGDVKYSHLTNNKTMYKWMYNLPKSSVKSIKNEIILNANKKDSFLTEYNMARIDIKNSGNEKNNIEIIDISDKKSKIYKPDWFKDQYGAGIQIESSSNNINLKLKAINDGTLFIFLKSLYKTDKEDNVLPIHITYQKVTINNNEQLEKVELATFNNPIIIKNEVKNNEIIEIYIEWKLWMNK